MHKHNGKKPTPIYAGPVLTIICRIIIPLGCIAINFCLLLLLLVRCQKDLASQQSSNDERVRSMSQELVARDLKLQTLEDMRERLREDLKKRDIAIEQ